MSNSNEEQSPPPLTKQSVDMGSDQEEERLIQKVSEIYDKISTLSSLKPSTEVNNLFTQLVLTCIPPNPINITQLSQQVQDMRSKLIRLCGEAEFLMETHFSTLLGSSSHENPLHHLQLFPYYSNYLKLSLLEHTILSRHTAQVPSRLAFVGSGPLPLTSIVLASHHMRSSYFHNYDIDQSANSQARLLVSADQDLSKRMFFHTSDIMDVTNALGDYEVVFLAALVGLDKEEKMRVLDHLAKYMAPGALLMLRSAHGARAFLYPVVDPGEIRGFEVLSVVHPSDEVINSVVIARKFQVQANEMMMNPREQQGHVKGYLMLPCKCSEIKGFSPLDHVCMPFSS